MSTSSGAPLFRSPKAEWFIPDGRPATDVLSGITHLGIGAHHDDLEFHALHGILKCWGQRSFAGITCTDGAGSSRSGPYANVSDDALQKIRRDEQNLAADLGKYGLMVQLGYSSAAMREAANPSPTDDLETLLRLMRPQVIYTHNLADKHASHVAVALRVIQALRRLPASQRPEKLLGFEGWRNLDWLSDREKIHLDVSAHPSLAAALSGVFDSQIAGGKRYDLAMDGRRAANATMADPYASDTATRVTYAMDLTPLIQDDSLDPLSYVLGFVQKFEGEIRDIFAQTSLSS